MKLSDIHIKPLIDTLKIDDISDEEYFGPKYKNYISNSRLTLLELNPKNPQRFFEGFRNSGGNKDFYIFGTSTHDLVLQPESYVLCQTIDRPTSKLGAMADLLYRKNDSPTYEDTVKASKEIDYYSSSWNEVKARDLIKNCTNYWNMRREYEKTIDKIPIYADFKTRNKIISCVDAVKSNNEFQDLLKDGTNEHTIFLNVEMQCPDHAPFVFHLKSKLDSFTIKDDVITVNDLKTTGKPIDEFNEAIDRFHYWRELAMYAYLLQLLAIHKYDVQKPQIKGNFLTVESFDPFTTKVFPMTTSMFNKGMREFTKLLKLAAFFCCQPDYDATNL